MFEMKIKVELTAVEVTEAVNNLANAIAKIGAPVVTPVATKSEPVHTPQIQEQPVMTNPVASPVQQPTAPQDTQPVVNDTPVATPAQPTAPQAPITVEMLSRAGAPLVDQGKMAQLMGLLNKYGVQAITQLKPDMYEAFAGDLRSLGAQI